MVFDATITRANPCWGFAVQQTISDLTKLPYGIFQGFGKRLPVLDWPEEPPGWVNLVDVGEKRVHCVGARHVGPDQGADGNGV